MVVCGECEGGFVIVGGSIRLDIAGDADARLACEGACTGGGPFGGCEARGSMESMVDPLTGS